MDQVQRFLTKLYRGVGTARSKRYIRYLERGQWDLLQRETPSHPSIYSSATMYLKDALITEVTRKLLLPGDTTSRYEKAVATFWASEAQCAATNARLHRFVHSGPYGVEDMPVIDFINRWRKIVRRVLGKLPQGLEPRFSGGSTLSDKGQKVTIPDKMSSQRTLYARGYDIYLHSVKHTILDQHTTPDFVRGNRFFTVPKDSQKDRGCCVEASGNVMLQLAVGHILKERYRRAYKVDLRYAQPLHRKAAQKASVDGAHATIDLSNASDTVASSLVRLLLPDDWHTLLNSLRAPVTDLDGKTVWLSKFSSMGNGFTFELETILFRTLCEAVGVGCDDALVFGDDIIVPTKHSRDVIAALTYFGFEPNKRKTFCEGPFRESCGGDYFLGKPVRAHYMKSLPDEPQKWIGLANGLRRADPHMHWVRAAWRFCVDQLPIAWRNFGPDWLEDLVIYDPDAEPTLHRFRGEHLSVPAWRVMRPVAPSRPIWKWEPQIAIVAATLVGSRVVTRDSISGYKPDWVAAWGRSDPDRTVDLFAPPRRRRAGL